MITSTTTQACHKLSAGDMRVHLSFYCGKSFLFCRPAAFNSACGLMKACQSLPCQPERNSPHHQADQQINGALRANGT